jgi:hypothetical protein
MATISSVRPSRDGDQFHYYWAARQCLRLLPPNADLVAISIEGPAIPDGAQVEEGIDSIDVAEYRGSTDPKIATHIRYIQLKHSSLRTEEEWIASDLARTLENFGARYLKFVSAYGEADVACRFSFEFVTNRPFAASLEQGLEQLRSGEVAARGRAAAKAMKLDVDAAKGFARLFTLTGRTQDFLKQRSLLHDDLSGYLPEADRDAPLQMKDLVEKRATTEFARRPEINRYDVLEALGTRVEKLYPAQPLIELPAAIVPRKQLRDLADQVISGPRICVIRADAGVGKSVLSTQLGALLPAGSQSFVYDCFGNGAYRSASGYRHRCRDGLVQLANEMAGRSLADPLIPTSKADAAAYMGAFKARAERAAALLKEQAPDALLCIVIDAADNAQIAADELPGEPSFPRLMLRESWPDNMRVVLTARPHRVYMLDPPHFVPRLDLQTFDEDESANHLRLFFPTATDQDVQEFHRQTSFNPRVQATALAQSGTLAEILLGLAGEPRTVDDLIGDLLQTAIDKVIFEAPKTEHEQIDRICSALATLRPFVPLEIVARIADVAVALVRSMANDLQRPLIVREGAIQFRDEPTETWFRDRFRPTGAQLDAFIERLLPAAAGSAYVAAGLPQLLLEAGRFDDLVRLALSDEALPDEPAMARRDVALQRLQFALKAAIRDKRYLDAAKLALKAGGETAADARQQKLISANTDLGRYFLEPEQMLEQVTRRLIAGGEWAGSEHGYEAAFLSGQSGLAGDAGSRLRLCLGWLDQWAKSARAGESKKTVKTADVAEMALASLNLHGAGECAKYLRRWRPRERSFKVGSIIVSRLVDAGRFDEIDGLAIAAGNDLGLLLAITSELAKVGRFPAEAAVARAIRLVTSKHVRIEAPADGFGGDIRLLGAVTDLVVAAVRHKIAPKRVLAKTLSRYFPDRQPSLEGHSANYQNSRSIYLGAYCLRAALRNEAVTAEKLKPIEMRPSKAKRDRIGRPKKSRRRYTSDHGEIARFEEAMAALLPWHLLAAEVQIGRVDGGDLAGRIAATAELSATGSKRIYDDRRAPQDEIAMLWGTIALGALQPANLIEPFEAWRKGLSRSLYTPTLIALSRHAGRTDNCAKLCLDLGRAAFALMAGEREDAQQIAEVFVEVCRSVLPVSPSEAREYFEQAIEVSGKIGEENLHRWTALSDLASAAGSDGTDRPELAYRFSRVAELVYAYTENFDWSETVTALVALSPPSGPTILSRWIDRRFARQHDTLGYLVTALRARDAIDPRDALSLLPGHALHGRTKALGDALRAAGKGPERERIASFFMRYARHLYFNAGDWPTVAKLFAEAGVDAAEANDLALQDERAAAAKAAGKAQPKEAAFRVERAERDWNAVFQGLALTDASQLARAHARLRSGKPPFSTEIFYREAISRVAAGQEAAFIGALDAAGFARLYDTREFLRDLPENWRQSLAVQRAMRRFLKGLARRECMSITTNMRYPAMPWDMLPQFGLSRADIFREAVTAMGDTALPVSYGDLFDLVGLLSTMVSAEDAAEALSYGLELMEPLLLEGDDGPWRPELAPPSTVPEALAGFVWAALGSPRAERRWEAAHVARALCWLDRAAALDALASFAEGVEGKAFAAPDLIFYAMHAQLWLTIALARAAEESPVAASRFLTLIDSAAMRENPHVLLRDFAAEALLAFHFHGQVALDDARISALRAINVSQLPPAPRRSGSGAFSNMWSVGSGFRFDPDFGKSWAGPLGSGFQASADDIQAATAKIIEQLWGAEETGSHKRDQREVRHQFNDDRDYRLQSDWPKVDELRSYQSVHAIMIVAGQLLDTAPAVASDESWGTFEEWIGRYRLSLGTGLWLADRRDYTPKGLWLDLPAGDTERRFDASVAGLLIMPDGAIVASADWEVHDDSIQQHVSVGSWLVSADRSDDLARALQTAHDHQDYRLPTAEGDSDEIDEHGWFLRSWLRSDERERRLDRYDPWSEGLRARVPAPGAIAAEALSLTADRSQRNWLDPDGRPFIRVEIWSDGEESDDQALHDRGRRLLAARAALDQLMERTGKHLLFELRLRTHRLETRYTRRRDKEKFDAVNLTRFLILRPGKDFEAATGIARTRGRARRAAASRPV